MTKNRLEAFSDGVFSIIITIMILELKMPEGAGWADLGAIWPGFITYALSFLYIGIYWSNHHHLFHTVHKISGSMLWANLFLLFWLSLFPFLIKWMDQKGFAEIPTAVYGLNLLLAAVAYSILTFRILAQEGKNGLLAKAIGKDYKGKTSIALYACGVLAAFGEPWLAQGFYILVAIIWIVPDRRIEKQIRQAEFDST